ncbi:WAT1-related protein At5g64700-like [Triticum aestivum]|uniref:WAT1-related protein At5g64700-like n=1 Tax=Triticum aestivum TaxID=4565 RepID=UPI001D02DC79|nr:WAT1-related protein At5g64700-like [Triticum aestivum]
MVCAAFVHERDTNMSRQKHSRCLYHLAICPTPRKHGELAPQIQGGQCEDGVVGALVCFGGALLISLYNGKELHLWSPIIKGIIMRRDKLAWQVGWNIQLLTIVYSAALGTAAKYWLNLYAVEKRGPVFPPMFNNLSVVFTMVLGTLLLGESLTVGSLLGSTVVFSGLYMYLYGKAKELHMKTTSGSSNEKLHVQPTQLKV